LLQPDSLGELPPRSMVTGNYTSTVTCGIQKVLLFHISFLLLICGPCCGTVIAKVVLKVMMMIMMMCIVKHVLASDSLYMSIVVDLSSGPCLMAFASCGVQIYTESISFYNEILV